MKVYADKYLLDWIDSIPLRENEGWILRQSSSGRGLRLHITTQIEIERIYGKQLPLFKTAREAITAYIEESQEMED